MRDLTGDGAADLIVRGVRHVSAAGRREPVDVEAIFIYQVNQGAITRVFAIETAREQGRSACRGWCSSSRRTGTSHSTSTCARGRAPGGRRRRTRGRRTRRGGQIEPLLLPWGGVDNLRYVWNGAKFAQKP